MHHLKRYPIRKNDPLQAWDSADELILNYLKGEELSGKKILIMNDSFGAITSGLLPFDITSYTDSFVSAEAIKLNTENKISPLSRLSEIQGAFDYVVMRPPKNLSYFEDLLCQLTHLVEPESKIILGVMVKHLSSGVFELLEKYFGKPTTSLAQKKARLIFSRPEKDMVTSPYPMQVKLDGFEKSFTHHSNLFSREKLDIGTRFFLEHLPQGDFLTILDLGCANGVVGIKAKELNPKARIIFSDESSMAIMSAKENYSKYCSDVADFFWTNCFENKGRGELDLVLCNPPFHQSHTVGDFIAHQMFLDAKDALKKGGLLRVIGNSHLGYQVKLGKLFGNSKIVATNSKFMIIDAIKRD